MAAGSALLGAAGMPSVSGAGGGGYSGEIKDELNQTARSQASSKTDVANDTSGASGNRGFVFTFNKGGGSVDSSGSGGVNPLVKGSASIAWMIGGLVLLGLIVFVVVKKVRG